MPERTAVHDSNTQTTQTTPHDPVGFGVARDAESAELIGRLDRARGCPQEPSQARSEATQGEGARAVSHTNSAPWTIIRSEDKHQARVNAMRIILGAVDYEDRDLSIDFVPDPAIVVSGAHEVELMDAEHVRKGRFTV